MSDDFCGPPVSLEDHINRICRLKGEALATLEEQEKKRKILDEKLAATLVELRREEGTDEDLIFWSLERDERAKKASDLLATVEEMQHNLNVALIIHHSRQKFVGELECQLQVCEAIKRQRSELLF